MKKIIFIMLAAVASMGSSTATAQSRAVQQASYVLPQTTLNVEITVCKEVIKKGPYAKYAQQYLGVTAPLSDKESYYIVSSSLTGVDEGDLSSIYVMPGETVVSLDSDVTCDTKPRCKGDICIENSITDHILFDDMGINPIVYKSTSSVTGRTSSYEKSLDDMAADAATAIFTLRKRRFDLVTGELGEYVFGAGLEAAIKEMARIEDEYLSLFVGKKSTTYTTQQFTVTPQSGKNSYVIARFDATTGLGDALDMSGEPVVITIAPEGKYAQQAVSKSSDKGAVTYRVADNALCKLFYNTTLLQTKRIPILQYGMSVSVVK